MTLAHIVDTTPACYRSSGYVHTNTSTLSNLPRGAKPKAAQRHEERSRDALLFREHGPNILYVRLHWSKAGEASFC